MGIKVDSAIVLTGAVVVGDVSLGEDVSVWHNAVLRGDINSISIGARSNIQDNCVVHVSPDAPVVLGDDVTVGHAAIIHGCTVEDNVLIGMGSIVMDGAHIGSNAMVGAGSLVTQNADIPSGTLAFGRPAKVVRDLTPEEIEGISLRAQEYVQCARDAKAQGWAQD